MTIDIYGTNPLAEITRESYPQRFEQVAVVKEPPRMFAGGTADYPSFTASGIDPAHLLKLPYGVRHAAAAEPDVSRAYAMFEEYAPGSPMLSDNPMIEHPGLDDAHRRMQDWLENTDLDTRSPEQRAADDEAEYAQFFRIDEDRASYSAEQRRRERAGEDPLEDFATLSERRRQELQYEANRGRS